MAAAEGRDTWRILAGAFGPDLRRALATLTILPVETGEPAQVLAAGAPIPPDRLPGHAFSWYPLVGLLIGLGLASAGALLQGAPLLRAAVVLLLWTLVTGARHLSEAGRVAGGLGALRVGAGIEQTWATVAVVALLLLKFAALASLPGTGLSALLVAPVAGRWALVAAAQTFARRSPPVDEAKWLGLGPPQYAAATATAAAVVLALLWFEPLVIGALIVAPVAAFGAGRWLTSRLGGWHGADIYGALCELTEAAVLFVLALPAVL